MTVRIGDRTVAVAELYGKPKTQRPVFTDGGCPACYYCHQFVQMIAGEVAFVVVGKDIYRTECMIDGQGFVCSEVTETDVKKELGV